MVILAIESSTEVCSVALSRDGEVIAIKESREGRDHARNVARFADELLRDNNIKADELGCVAVSSGPGSYTGLRIGLSFAKGLCYGANIKLICVNTMEALVAQLQLCGIAINRGEMLAPMVDARRMEVYTQLYNDRAEACGERNAMVVDEGAFADIREQGGGLLIFGDGAEKCREVLPWARYFDVAPSATGVTKVAYEAMKRGDGGDDVAYCEPFYLKDVMITKSKKKFF